MKVTKLVSLSVTDCCVCFVAPVLLQLIQQLGSKHWCAVPLLFLSQALSKLPPDPVLGTDGLTALRYLFMFTVRQTASVEIMLHMGAHFACGVFFFL